MMSSTTPARSRMPRSLLRAGFTLIEVMVVVVVLGLLAATVAPNVFSQVGVAKEESARSQIAMLGTALDAYRLDNDRYPSESQGLEALWREPVSDPLPRNWRGPYLRKPVPVDPWGNAYVYSIPGRATSWGFGLMSLGADGREGGMGEDADITSWD